MFWLAAKIALQSVVLWVVAKVVARMLCDFCNVWHDGLGLLYCCQGISKVLLYNCYGVLFVF